MLSFLFACVEPWEAHSEVDEGDVCLYVGAFDPFATVGKPAGTETAFTTTDAITVHYVPLYCFSSSCTRNIFVSCDTEVADDRITIHGTGSWEVAAGNQECTADCGLGDTQCTIEALPEGSYEIAFGDAVETLAIPSTDTICLSQ